MTELHIHSDTEASEPRRGDDRPMVSVVMSMRNSATTVGAAVRSIQLQTLANWELIVIDDGSSDDSAAVVSAARDPRIRLLRYPTSLGLAARLNQGIALSRGDFIARMDADDVCLPERLVQQVEALQQDPSIDVLGCGAAVFTDAGQLVGVLPVGLTHEVITAHPFRGFPLPHPTWCGRAEWFRANPYDPNLMKTQDQDLLLRTYHHSRFAALADVLLLYRQDQLDLRKMLRGRWIYSRAIWRSPDKPGFSLKVLAAIAAQLGKAAIDMSIMGLGLHRFAQRSRLRPVPEPVWQQWRELQRQLDCDKASC